MHRYTIIRVALLVAIILVWRWAARAHPAMADAGQWAGGALVWTGAAILAFYIIACFIIILRARHHGGPDIAMGIGCAMIIAFALIAIGALLAVGIVFHVAWMVTIISIGTILTFIPIGVGLTVEGYKALKKRRERKDAVPSKSEIRIPEIRINSE